MEQNLFITFREFYEIIVKTYFTFQIIKTLKLPSYLKVNRWSNLFKAQFNVLSYSKLQNLCLGIKFMKITVLLFI